MGAHFAGREYRLMRSTVLRYSLASFELTFMQAQGDDAELWRLVNRKILREDEAAKLRDLPSRAQAIWTWQAWIFHELQKQGKMSDNTARLYYEKCVQARGAIGGVLTFLNTQLPFFYVQLLAAIVHVLCFVVAVEVGLSNSRFMTAILDPGDEPASTPLVYLLQLIMVPLFYYGCLEIGRVLTDPLGRDFEDFPRHAYHFWMRREAQAFHSTFEEPTSAAKEAVTPGAKGRRSVVSEQGSSDFSPTPPRAAFGGSVDTPLLTK
eukprot:SRR837773.3731.p1 GENE.SRR837773.3731~~SRR837773.3731.p1  ORF type:complete len:289 (-),score=68.22 SRR837773.3731:170-961(-)